MMQNVIDACSKCNANLIFLDNVYMYGPAPLAVPFNENHPQQPVLKKGTARKHTADLLLEAFERNKINGVIGRSADFYGPRAVNSQFYVSFLQNMLKGKAPQSLVKPGIKHTYSYTVDNAKALVSLALSPETYGQVWHLPVGEPITIEELTELFNQELGTSFKPSFMPPVLRKALSVFIPIFKDLGEMLYQYDTEYNMSFEKFSKHFPNFAVTSYQQGIREMVRSFRQL
jgi:nucleoside-diphosphate-sugar epimerase